MTKLLGHVRELVRYPVKSMAGVPADSAFLGFHGLAGDRRFAFRRIGDDSGFPWLTASRVPALILYHPFGLDETSGEPLPTHVRTPDGSEVGLRSAELQNEIAERFGGGVELMKLKHGIFDDGAISVISLATMAGISAKAGVSSIAGVSAETSCWTPATSSRSSRTSGSAVRCCSAPTSRGRR